MRVDGQNNYGSGGEIAIDYYNNHYTNTPSGQTTLRGWIEYCSGDYVRNISERLRAIENEEEYKNEKQRANLPLCIPSARLSTREKGISLQDKLGDHRTSLGIDGMRDVLELPFRSLPARHSDKRTVISCDDLDVMHGETTVDRDGSHSFQLAVAALRDPNSDVGNIHNAYRPYGFIHSV